MVSDSLINNIAADTGNVYIPAEFRIFGDKSIVYNSVSEMPASKTIDHSEHIVKSGVAAGLSVYFLMIFIVLKSRIPSISKMLTDYRFTRKQYEATSRIRTINTTYTVLFTIIVASIQFSLMVNYQEYKMMATPFLALSGIFIIQPVALRLVALICKSENIFGEIHLNRKFYLSILGMAILPLTIVALLYSGTRIEEIALVISKILAAILILFMTIRIMRVFAKANVSYFFRFLYLCTFEISPYLVLFIIFENINK
ncbi:MAG: DUF4271 domain-containing protein [Prevotellaceae bacterium]|jgi:hypothetical protein|nr:DUF4271 domain-containing protein [Prevotellaceae bacterium]